MTSFILLALTSALAFLLPVTTGSAMINLGGIFVGIAGMLLDLSLKYLVVQFEPQIYTAIAGQLGEVWTVFRDIANIVIIGMFTFIAISTILGIESFGARKLIARVLIIAVLINFSLLFTRIIIGSSNFVAGKFYTAMSLDSVANTAAANSPTSGSVIDTISNYASTAGISGQFVNLLGLPSALNARGTVDAVYANKNGGRAAAVMYSFTAAALMVATALVLAYAIFLLVARTILFLFLLAISALAFASYLVPKWGDKYWSMWWGALLRNAIFGPLLMLMLWTTLTISYALVSGPGQNRSFDKLFSDPTNGSGVLALLIFFIILGMLYGSVRFASSFSKKIDGFNWAAVVPAIGFGAAARAAGFAARIGFGGPSAYVGRKLQEQSQKEGRSQLGRQLFDFGSQAFKGVAKKDFSLMRTQFGKEIQGVAGFKSLDTLAGKKQKDAGFEGMQKRRAEGFAEQAARMSLTDTERKDVETKAIKEVIAEQPALAERHAAATQVAESTKQDIDRMIKEQGVTMETFTKNMQTLQSGLVEAQREAASAPADKTARDNVKNVEEKIAIERQNQASEIQKQTKRIQDARILADKTEGSMKTELRRAAVQAGKLPAAFKGTGDLASEIAHNRFTNVLAKAVGISNEENDVLAKAARKQVGEKKNRTDAKRVADYLKSFSPAETPAPPPPPAAPSGGGAH